MIYLIWNEQATYIMRPSSDTLFMHPPLVHPQIYRVIYPRSCNNKFQMGFGTRPSTEEMHLLSTVMISGTFCVNWLQVAASFHIYNQHMRPKVIQCLSTISFYPHSRLYKPEGVLYLRKKIISLVLSQHCWESSSKRAGKRCKRERGGFVKSIHIFSFKVQQQQFGWLRFLCH